MQDTTIQYNTIKYNTIRQHTRYLSIRKITKNKTPERILYSVKTQKRAEHKVEESALKTIRCANTKTIQKYIQ